MLHKQLVVGISLGLGSLMFLVLLLCTWWALYGVFVSAAGGCAAFALNLGVCCRHYQRCSALLAQMEQRLCEEEIVYADVASYMENRHEYPGAIVVTRRRLRFESPPDPRGQAWAINILLTDVALTQNIRGRLRIATVGGDNRFKVFRCDELVQAVQRGAAPPVSRPLLPPPSEDPALAPPHSSFI